jgi:hypothetical protein
MNKAKSGSPGENGFDPIPSRKKKTCPPLLGQPLDELRQQQRTTQNQDHRERMDSIQYLAGRRRLVRPF